MISKRPADKADVHALLDKNGISAVVTQNLPERLCTLLRRVAPGVPAEIVSIAGFGRWIWPVREDIPPEQQAALRAAAEDWLKKGTRALFW